MSRDFQARENNEHPFAAYVRILGKGRTGSRSLTAEEAEKAMGLILDDECLDLQLGAFLMLLRVKEETPDELAGFVRATQARMPFKADELAVDIDWSSYAGKRRHPPWFLLALKVLAGRGYKILIHGAEGHTAGRIYTRSCLPDLDICEVRELSQTPELLEAHGLVYLPLEVLSPRLNDIIQMRSLLGLRSPVHSMARLLNPLHARVVLQGIFHPPYAGLHQKAADLLGYESTLVVKGDGGEIERNPSARCRLFLGKGGELSEELWEPYTDERFAKASELDPGRLKELWAGHCQDTQGELAVLGTLAWAIRALDLAVSQDECLAMAKDWWAERLSH